MSGLHVVDRLDDHLEGDLSLAERALVDAHLAGCEACAREMRELRATVGLLRGLPDPEHSANLGALVMSRIEAGEARPPFFLRLYRGMAVPEFAAPLAAGIAVVLMFVQFGGWDLLGLATTPPPGPVVATLVPAGDRSANASAARRPPPVRWTPARVGTPPARHGPAVLAGYEPGFPGRRFVALPAVGPQRTAPVAPLRDLDAEIAEAMWHPDVFVARVQNTHADARRPLLAPLIEQSARHGDFAVMARHLGMAAQPAAYTPSGR